MFYEKRIRQLARGTHSLLTQLKIQDEQPVVVGQHFEHGSRIHH